MGIAIMRYQLDNQAHRASRTVATSSLRSSIVALVHAPSALQLGAQLADLHLLDDRQRKIDVNVAEFVMALAPRPSSTRSVRASPMYASTAASVSVRNACSI
jgi:hypothetical protein